MEVLDTIEAVVDRWESIYTEDDENGGAINPFYLIDELRAVIRAARSE